MSKVKDKAERSFYIRKCAEEKYSRAKTESSWFRNAFSEDICILRFVGMKMDTVRIGDICEILNGFAFKSENYVESGIRVIRIANVQKGYIEDSAPVFYPADSIGLEKYLLERGDLLMSLTGNVGRVAILGEEFLPAALNQRVACLRMKSNRVSKGYLYHILNSDYFEKKCILSSKGVAQKNMSTEWLKDYEIPVYAEEKQAEIVHTFDLLQNIIANRQQELQKLDEMIKARFVEMFGDPLNGTAKWPFNTVGDVAESVDPQPSHRTPPIDADGIPYISIKDRDYKTGEINFDGARKVSRDVLEEHRKRYNLHDGDFIIGKIGTVGNPIFVPARHDYTLSANIVLIQPEQSKVSPYYLKYSFMSAYIDRQFEEAKNSTSQAAFGIQKVRQIKVMNPDLKEQYRFEEFARQVDKSKDAVKKSLAETQLLFDSLMQQYFG